MAYRTDVDLTTDARNLHMTKETLEKEGKKAMEMYSPSFNRTRLKARAKAMSWLCSKRATVISGYRVGDRITYLYVVNLGTRQTHSTQKEGTRTVRTIRR